MESLLRWSIQNSTPLDSAPSDRPPVRREDLNPEIIDMILGKPDSQLMKEDVAAAIDESKSEDERINALDHLEMLIEQIDNANNLEKLKLWEPLQTLLASNASLDIKIQVLWVIGTAVQNNPAAQDSYLQYNPLPSLLSFLSPSPESTVQTRSKAVYALSALLRHNAPALRLFEDPQINGWDTLKTALQDPELAVRKKTAFLLGALLTPTLPNQETSQQPPLLLQDTAANPNQIPAGATTHEGPRVSLHNPDTRPAPVDAGPANPIHDNSHAAHLRDATRSQTSPLTVAAFKKHGLLDTLVSSLVSPVPYGPDGEHTELDPDYEEKTLRVLYTYIVVCQKALDDTQKKTLKKWIEGQKAAEGGQAQLEEKWSFTSSEFKALYEKL